MDKLEKLEARIAKLESDQAKQLRILARLHTYLKRTYEAVKFGLSIDKAGDYAVDPQAKLPTFLGRTPTRLSGSAATGIEDT